tara:strand:+ start:76 stop:927 length:852 start_codon:yes stop_codon:yes gene_type:complete
MSGGHSEIDKLINHFDGGGTRDSFKRGGKVEEYKKGGKVLSEDLSLSHKEAGHTPDNPPKGMVYDPITKKFVTKPKSKGESVISPKKKSKRGDEDVKMTILGVLPTGKDKIYKEGGKPMTAQEEASDDAAYYAHIRKTNPDKYYKMFPDAPGEPGDEVGPFGVKDGAFSKKKIRERKEKRRTRKHKRHERKMERKHGEDWDVHGKYDESGTWVPDKPKKAGGGKIKEEDFAAHVEEATSMDKSYSEYNRPKTSYEVAPKKEKPSRRKWKHSKKGSLRETKASR